MKNTLTIGIMGILLCFGGMAQAAPVTIAITGEVTFIGYDTNLQNTIHVGDIFTGTYTYDSSSINTSPYNYRGDYVYSSPYGISLSLDGFEFKTALTHTDGFMVSVENDHSVNIIPYDRYDVYSTENAPLSDGSSISSIEWFLSDNTHTALSSIDLPLLPPVLSEWNYSRFGISGYDSFDNNIYITGNVTQAVLVPEPVTSTLLITGCVFFLRRKR